jgi:hypothetical protein
MTNIGWRVAMNAMLYRLNAIHGRLDDEIRHELKRRLPDAVRLKTSRLAAKDRLPPPRLRSRSLAG